MNRQSKPIPEGVAQLQRQLEQFRSTQPGRTKLPESLWQTAVELARQHGVYPVADPLRLGNEAGIRGISCAVPSTGRRMPDRVRVPGRKQDASPVEGHRSARLDHSAAGVAGNDRMIQITAQMRVLVAIEAVATVQVKLPLLATWLGHVSILSTYHYLHFVEDLRLAADRRFIDSYGSVVVPVAKSGVSL
jgi:hypothetical protein